MKLETVKTFILTVLIGISLLLSFVISNYQPSFDPIQSNYVEEVDVGGDEAKKRTVIQPNSLMVHAADQTYSHHNANERQHVFENMQEWLFSDLSLTNPPNIQKENKSIELSFPTSIPLEMLPNLFNLSDGLDLPNWSFNQILITMDESVSSVNIYFPALNGENAAKFTVSESDAFTYLSSIAGDVRQLSPYIPFGAEREQIYIPADEVEVKRRSLAIELIDPASLVNALFTNPSLVNHTIGEDNYNDGQRGMTVLNNDRSMEFINPIHSEDKISFPDLIELSIDQINNHNGWTNDYILSDIDLGKNRLQYQMYYDGYPVYSHRDYSRIEQKWRNQDLYQYKRPLFKLTDLLNSETVTLPSGVEIEQHLHEESNYDIEKITDVQIGYRLKYEDASFSVVLDPSWYIQYNNSWLEIRMSSSETPGNEEAA